MLSDKLARRAPQIRALTTSGATLEGVSGRIVVSSGHPRVMDVIRMARWSGGGRVLLLVESGLRTISPAMMEALARVRDIRSISVDEERNWADIVAAWLRAPLVVIDRQPAGARRSSGSRRAA